MKTILAIGFGSGLGGICRYLLSTAIGAGTASGFPYGTLAVNIAGCLLIGLVFSWAEGDVISRQWRLYLATGLLGGFTTFSAFSAETVLLLRGNQITQAAAYVLLSVAGGLAATFAGFWLGRLA